MDIGEKGEDKGLEDKRDGVVEGVRKRQEEGEQWKGRQRGEKVGQKKG